MAVQINLKGSTAAAAQSALFNASNVRVFGSHQTDEDKWAQEGRWARVKSSNVYAIRYDRINHRLFVQFRHAGTPQPGQTYAYERVGKGIAIGMFQAASMGQFVHYVLKKRGYAYHKTPFGYQDRL